MNRFPGHLFARVFVLLLTLALLAPAALAQSSGQGGWQTLPYPMPINPVHVALLHSGKVLIVSGSGNVAGNTNFRAALWDPQAGTITTQPVSQTVTAPASASMCLALNELMISLLRLTGTLTAQAVARALDDNDVTL